MTKRTYSRPKRKYGVEMDCDICGKHKSTAIAIVEGAQVAVCNACTRFGTVLHLLSPDIALVGESVRAPAPIESEEIVENYAKIVRSKREKMGLPLAVVAERIREKESYLEKIEKGALLPSLSVARKLEHELGVKLVETTKEEVAPTAAKPTTFAEPSLSDLLEASKKKK